MPISIYVRRRWGKPTVRIPLDYYRILGLPILATAEQLKQAKSERLLQAPRREFSDNAVDSRARLLNQAYDMLSDPETRRTYDARFLANSQETDANVDPASDHGGLEIDIDESRFLGALLLLQELGEYEWVLKLGRPYLTSGNATSLQSGAFGEPQEALGDIVLTLALACLELGREEWQQARYDNASEALETGQELLLREGLFAGVRSEIQSDLYKLRPYRILAMLADNDVASPRRDRGKLLLQEMLDERGGIDGNGNDQSGLGVEDFLRFVQQLRDYLTVDEQQTLFEAEARRPSGVATYLAVYALLAKGFSRSEPALVRRAKAMLTRLGGRQDVYLEQSVCALLLGQTEEASKALERSQEYEPLSFIRSNSKGAPDLLPGLCLYSERWFREEVFPHFRDLMGEGVTLRTYFADEQVQAYLEELPAEPDMNAAGKWINQPAPRNRTQERSSKPEPNSRSSSWAAPAVAAGTAAIAISHKVAKDKRPTMGELSSNPRPEPIPNPAIALEGPADYWVESSPEAAETTPPALALSNGKTPADLVVEPKTPTRRRKSPASEAAGEGPKWLWLLGIGLVTLAGFLLIRMLKNQPGKVASVPQVAPISMDGLNITLDKPLMILPEDSATGGIQGDLTPDTAKQVLELWLTAKRGAMGSTYAADQLTQVLTGNKLAEWQRYSAEAKAEGWYKDYKHAVKVDKVEANPNNPNQAAVTATIEEFEQFYEGGNLGDTRQDNLSLTYAFVKQDNQWKIESW
jgi:curved DNA-binding protein CbpA